MCLSSGKGRRATTCLVGRRVRFWLPPTARNLPSERLTCVLGLDLSKWSPSSNSAQAKLQTGTSRLVFCHCLTISRKKHKHVESTCLSTPPSSQDNRLNGKHTCSFGTCAARVSVISLAEQRFLHFPQHFLDCLNFQTNEFAPKTVCLPVRSHG